MENPNSSAAKGVGQAGTSKEMVEEYDKRHGMYDNVRNNSGKPTSAGPGTLANTPSPFNVRG